MRAIYLHASWFAFRGHVFLAWTREVFVAVEETAERLKDIRNPNWKDLFSWDAQDAAVGKLLPRPAGSHFESRSIALLLPSMFRNRTNVDVTADQSIEDVIVAPNSNVS